MILSGPDSRIAMARSEMLRFAMQFREFQHKNEMCKNAPLAHVFEHNDFFEFCWIRLAKRNISAQARFVRASGPDEIALLI